MQSMSETLDSLKLAWSEISDQCLSVLGSELHYQAMIYHCLRTTGRVPIDQIGMNVKMYVDSPVSTKFRELDQRKHKDFRGGFEPIPDVAIFGPAVKGDWRRRNRLETLVSCLMAIEVKASERAGSRLRPGEIREDISKLSAHREEAISRGSDFLPVMLVIDSARESKERMTPTGLESARNYALESEVGFLYASPVTQIVQLDIE